VTHGERDELMRAVALHLQGYRELALADAAWEGSSNAVLHHVHSVDEMFPYISQPFAAAPR
jgi:hypothetical protein